MDAIPPFPVISGQRQLAVIMFTDAVSFSARMHAEELATLNRLERDIEVMRRRAEEHSGMVLKTTGDGLLIQFSSAVQAMACALEIQRHFAAPLDPHLTQAPLRHRIGIHLGDVFVGNNDVMGDGVNIAARLMNEAGAGGIIISQTVYDVVKNKLPLHIQRLGPRQLKNISDPVTLYRVLLEAPAAGPAAPAFNPAPLASNPKPRSHKLLLALALVGGLILAGQVLHRQYRQHQAELARSQFDQAALGAALKHSSPAAPASEAVSAGAPAIDFARLAAQSSARTDPAVRIEAERHAVVLLAWIAAQLEGYTRDRPLSVPALGNPAFQGTVVFTDSGHQLYFLEGGASRRRDWAELKEPVQAAIIVAALAGTSSPVPAEVRQGAEAFAYLHGLPEMIPALRH